MLGNHTFFPFFNEKTDGCCCSPSCGETEEVATDLTSSQGRVAGKKRHRRRMLEEKTGKERTTETERQASLMA